MRMSWLLMFVCLMILLQTQQNDTNHLQRGIWRGDPTKEWTIFDNRPEGQRRSWEDWATDTARTTAKVVSGVAPIALGAYGVRRGVIHPYMFAEHLRERLPSRAQSNFPDMPRKVDTPAFFADSFDYYDNINLHDEPPKRLSFEAVYGENAPNSTRTDLDALDLENLWMDIPPGMMM